MASLPFTRHTCCRGFINGLLIRHVASTTAAEEAAKYAMRMDKEMLLT